MKLVVNTEILSLSDIPFLAEKFDKTVLLLRHSMRETLNHGLDPGLTAEGRNYALQCGKLLTGLADVSFGASPRKRTIETAQALQEGGKLGNSEIDIYTEIQDTALFTHPENLALSLQNGNLPEILKEYFSTGKAPGTIDLEVYSGNLLNFLIETKFKTRNTILLSHDIICASLLLPQKVYPFKLDDWCGYIQGGALLLSGETCHLYYIVPSVENRKKSALFI
jgi:hypothetical protein